MMEENSEKKSSLLLDQPWSISEAGFRALVSDMATVAPRSIVEFGSGLSTIRLALEFPEAKIISIEHWDEGVVKTRALCQEFSVGDRVEVQHRALQWMLLNHTLVETYNRGGFSPAIDAVLIDGPPYYTSLGRLGCLPQVIPYLHRGSRVYLDDYTREIEKQAVAYWLKAYPFLKLINVLYEGHHIAVLELQTDPSDANTDVLSSVRSIALAGRILARRTLSRIRKAL